MSVSLPIFPCLSVCLYVGRLNAQATHDTYFRDGSAQTSVGTATETKVRDQTFNPSLVKYTDTGPTVLALTKKRQRSGWVAARILFMLKKKKKIFVFVSQWYESTGSNPGSPVLVAEADHTAIEAVIFQSVAALGLSQPSVSQSDERLRLSSFKL